jgi:ribulose 1,5-bisphosphate synthetase/thiazole synthase
VGRELGQRQGSGGVKGAALGALAVGGLRRMGPLGMLLGGGYVAKKAYDRRRAGRV